MFHQLLLLLLLDVSTTLNLLENNHVYFISKWITDCKKQEVSTSAGAKSKTTTTTTTTTTITTENGKNKLDAQETTVTNSEIYVRIPFYTLLIFSFNPSFTYLH